MKSLSKLDKDLLMVLLAPDGERISSKAIAEKLGVPAVTVQRRRRKLEDELLNMTYSLDLKRFGWHRVDFLIATERGKTISIAKQLSKLDDFVYVGRSIGQQTIDLHTQAILGGNADILRIMELLKSMPGIKDVVWSEIVEVIGKKPSVPTRIINRL